MPKCTSNRNGEFCDITKMAVKLARKDAGKKMRAILDSAPPNGVEDMASMIERLRGMRFLAEKLDPIAERRKKINGAS